MKNRKRILALVLTAIMTISMLPTAAFAAEADGADTAAEPAVETVSVSSEEVETQPTVEDVSEEKAQEPAAEPQPEAPADPAPEEDTTPAEEPATEVTEPAQEETGEAAEEATEGTEAQAEEVPAETETEEPEKTSDEPVTLTFKGSDYTVTATFDASAGFPDGVQMKASEIKQSAQEYETYYDQALEKVQKETENEVAITHARFFDITFYTEEGDVEPTGPVNVSIKYDKPIEVENKADVNVLHFDEKKDAPELMDASAEGKGNKVDEVTFDTTGFSIYAVVAVGEAGDYARVTVNFYGANTESPVATMYVKNKDTRPELNTIIYDPGAGEIPAGYAFYGWCIDNKEYGVDTEAKTIDEVRDYLASLAITEGMNPVNIYAKLLTSYKIDYVDSNGTTSLGSQHAVVKAKGDVAAHTVSMGYPTDSTHVHEGWMVTDGISNVVTPAGITPTTVLENGTAITIKGDIRLSVSAPQGHWLIFDENGEDATYNAPRFVKSGENTSAEGLLEMKRMGYTFVGWYKDAAGTDPFTFGGQIQEETTIYAKWQANNTAQYSILIWKQNVAGTGYDFQEYIPLQGTVGTTINTVSQIGTGDGAYARINGENKQYTGFHLRDFSRNVTIKPEGSSVVNVYYDRNEYTLTFYRQQGMGWVTVKTITARYEQNIADQFPIPGYEDARWSPWYSQTFNQVLVFLDIMPAESVTFLLNESNYDQKHARYYIEALPGQTPDRVYNGMNFVLYKGIDPKYGFFTEAEDYISLVGFTKGGTDYPPEGYGNYNATTGEYSNKRNTVWNNSNVNYLLCYYTRDEYPITYMDGVYVDANNNPLHYRNEVRLDTTAKIPYNQDISSYNKGGEDAYTPTTYHDGFVFEGWCIDEACTQPYTFDKMTQGGITVYAKWRQIQYRVFLHPNAGRDTTLTWGSDNQATNFRVSYGSKISTPTGKRTGYDFYGWYLDEALSNGFPSSMMLNETTVTTPYNKTTDFTDPMNKWGDGATYNSDINGWDDDGDSSTPGKDRFWVTKRFDLYARWSKTTEGADGIGVLYDPNGGANEPHDTTLYIDNSNAVAGAASTPPTGKVFSHWVVQKWNGSAFEDTDKTVLPGEIFAVLVDNAQIKDEDGHVVTIDDIEKGKTYSYTVHVRAEYATPEEEKPTRIKWFKNDGSGTAYREDTGIKINEAVDVYGLKAGETIPERKGYTFLGWTKATEDNSGSTNKTELFITYNAETRKYDYEQVAADEVAPLEALYAVWEKIPGYYVYYSSQGVIKWYPMPDGTVNLTAQKTLEEQETVPGITKGYLYGGYYESDENGTKGKACTASGKTLEPHNGDYFYLKEVDYNYLKPMAYVVYNRNHNGLIMDLYGIVNVDADSAGKTDYQRCGVIINPDASGAGDDQYTEDPALQYSVEKSGVTVEVINGESMGTEGAALGAFQITDYVKAKATVQIRGYWVTQDNIKVTGFRDRMIRFDDTDSRYAQYSPNVCFTGWIGHDPVDDIYDATDLEPNTKTGLKTIGTKAEFVNRLLAATAMSVRSKAMLFAPSDNLSYTITKVYSNSTDTQTVEEGDQTGKITYKAKSGYMFAGWYQDKKLTVPADFSKITGDMTVYAKYVSKKDVKVSFARKKNKTGNVVFNVKVSIKNTNKFAEVGVNINNDGNTSSASLKTKSKTNTGTKKKPKYTYKFQGTATVKKLAKKDTFKVNVYWVTPDGTKVTGETRTCKYKNNSVTVR